MSMDDDLGTSSEFDPAAAIAHGQEGGAGPDTTHSATIATKKKNTFDDHVFELIPLESVDKLRIVADLMVPAGYASEFVHKYSATRSDVLCDCLVELGMEKLRIHEVHRTAWKNLNDKMNKSVRVIRTVVRPLLASEQRLCAQVLAAFRELQYKCFVHSTEDCIILIRDFGYDVLAMCTLSPEKISWILDTYQALDEVIPELKPLFFRSYVDDIIHDLEEVLERLGGAVNDTLLDFWEVLQRESSWPPMMAGEIHPMTCYVMNYLRSLAVYKGTLDTLLDDNGAGDVDHNALHSGTDEDDEYLNSLTPFGRRLVKLMSYLEANLDEKSKLYEDGALQCIFSMNNTFYIVQNVNDSELGRILGDHWIQRRHYKIRQKSTGYLRGSWTKVLSYLKDDGDSSNNRGGIFGRSGNLRSRIKQKFKNFYWAFDEVYRSQTLWNVPDPQLREELKISISGYVIPAYRAFVGRYASLVDNGRNSYIKYTPEDLENHLFDLFEGSIGSADHSRTKYKSFEGNHTNLRLKEIEVQHSTLYSDLKSWLAMGELRQHVGFHHSCLLQASQQLHFRDDIKKLIREDILLKRNDGNNCTVICIISESGLGKTSLLHALYNDRDFLDTFDKRIWIQMSAKFDREILFRKIIEFPTHAPCTITNLSFLEEMVKETLADKRSMIFLDDAEIEDQHFWTNVLEVLSTGAKGSAVVVATTCGTSGALTAGATHSYRLGPLSEENNLMLLEQYAGKGHDIKSYPELVSIAKKFIARFGANPLNLKALGGLLCHTDTVILEQNELEGNIISCLHICHDVLPEYLKNCLAFCSLFPKGYIFDRHRTVLLWLSQGFVAPVVGREPEDVAIEYFNELLCRSFFQYSPSHNFKDNKFVMHELIYNVVASVSRNKYFKSEDLVSSIPENTVHLSLVSSQFQTVELMSKTEELKDLQTFLVVQQPEWQPYKISLPTLNLVGLDDFFLKFTSIQTLDLSHTDTEELPGSIAGLRNLQYLSVNNTSIRSLPSELCSLSNLRTLEAKDCRFLTELPGDTKKLLKLRHLDVTKELDYVHLPHGIGHLTELRTLPVFHANRDSSRCSISELGNLHNLRGSLLLSGLESVKTGSNAQEANLKDKHHLKDLTLQWHDGDINIYDEDEDEDTENVAEQVLERLQPHTDLQELTIRGYEGSSFPSWMQDSSSMPNLVSLTLDCCYNCTEFIDIAQLPSLKFLSVRKMYGVQRLITNNIHGSTTKFPSLELLNLWEMYGLEELFEASEGDCPRLRKICISRCPDLKRLPCSPSVRELVLHCGRELPDIPELASLVSLKIEGFHGVKSFGLPALPLLKKVEIRSCKELVSVDGLSALTTVQRLKIAGCPKLVLPTTDGSLTT